MRLSLPVRLAAALVLAWVAVAPAAAQPSSPLKRGQEIAERLCARCHSIAATGVSPQPLAPPFRTLARRYPLEHLAEALAEGIVTGHPDMPQFKFSPTEIDALLSFIDGLALASDKGK
jgi:mono/diheme cytochrome c family protein